MCINFTFHNVSINTEKLEAGEPVRMVALHSTMFLLILQIAANIIGEHIVFTFHNVSINTERRIRKTKREVLFTFHNVSINTRSSFSILSLVPLFTFHNVSINTTF